MKNENSETRFSTTEGLRKMKNNRNLLYQWQLIAQVAKNSKRNCYPYQLIMCSDSYGYRTSVLELWNFLVRSRGIFRMKQAIEDLRKMP